MKAKLEKILEILNKQWDNLRKLGDEIGDPTSPVDYLITGTMENLENATFFLRKPLTNLKTRERCGCFSGRLRPPIFF